ncbi:hypothetical protein IFM89_015462 [Coptis chinensis]|uniref:Short-chain dehydrogenase TIC 32, chloroplastic n=1 Tax=Coptis chinensis TaxID=261450 RepID=A0A835IE67_9MAGN|nr:hypothetical protein IFM89_015462 [Coptis chinensis]
MKIRFNCPFSGHFLLTNLLLETMKKTAQENNVEGRILNLSSEGHRYQRSEGIQFDKINDKARYSSLYAYNESKLANVLHANELARRLKEDGVQITANSLHPGVITTDLLRHHTIINGIFKTVAKYFVKNVQQGAATTCYMALHPQVKGVSGEYFLDSNKGKPVEQAKDMELAEKLWDFSMGLIN